MSLFTLGSKVLRHARLLRDDPERFGANLLQFTNPQRFHQKVIGLDLPPKLHVRVDPALAGAHPWLTVMIPALGVGGMTGGPNTVLLLAWHLARAGIGVRVLSTVWKPDADAAEFWRGLARLTGSDERPANLQLILEHGADRPLSVGPDDWFLATHWHTAHQLRPILPRMRQQRFLYLIQDFEPGFYAFSGTYAACLETYRLDHVPIFNQALVRDHFALAGVGPAAGAPTLAFEPAVDRSVFHPAAAPRTGRRRLLFYARPTNPRNMFGTGLAALRAVAADAAFAGDWEFVAIGGAGKLPAFDLGGGRVLQQAPWRDYEGYAALLRESDMLLCLMLSPHTSYPVLEMAASGGQVVTNSFGSKTAERLARIAPGVIVADADPERIAAGLIAAAGRIGDASQRPSLTLPASWPEAISPVVGAIAGLLARPDGA